MIQRRPTMVSNGACCFTSSTRASKTSTSSSCASGSMTANSLVRVRLHPDSRDPLTGTQDSAESIFVIPQTDGSPPIELRGLSSFVTTKAAAYVFLPSITAIRWMAGLGENG